MQATLTSPKRLSGPGTILGTGVRLVKMILQRVTGTVKKLKQWRMTGGDLSET